MAEASLSIVAGGKDVIRLDSKDEMNGNLVRATDRPKSRSAMIILMPAGNVGNAPFLFFVCRNG